jgi:hypothetical protein
MTRAAPHATIEITAQNRKADSRPPVVEIDSAGHLKPLIGDKPRLH